MTLGDTFLNLPHGRVRSHFWFVVSNPTGAGRVAIVNVSSENDGLDGLPTLLAADHPWLKHESFIRTDFAVLAPTEKIEAALRNPLVAVPKTKATAETLAKLHIALRDSGHTPREVRAALEEQGFISTSSGPETPSGQ